MMSVLLAVDDGLAVSLRDMLPGEVERHEPDLRMVPLAQMAEEGPRALASAVARKAPQVLVAGVKMGGNGYSGMDGVRLVLKAPKPPAVVVLIPKASAEARRLGAELGVYRFIETRGLSDPSLVESVTEAVILASAWRDGFSPKDAKAPPRLSRKPPRKKLPRR
jgi:DNA-binding NarL/FixJ family response regulator